MPEIIVIGGSFSGMQTIKALAGKIPADYHITLVEPSDEVVWTIGLPRGLIQPAFAERLFVSLEERLAAFPNVSHVQTYAESVDPAAKTVTLRNGDSLSYDYLVVASGASSSTPWKFDLSEHSLTPAKKLRQYLGQSAEAIKQADTIVIGGAGPVGVETAGEIVGLYPNKRIVLVNSHATLLEKGGWPAWLGTKLETALKSRSVEIISSTRVVSPSETTLAPTTVELSTGSPIQDAVYISSIGFKPNSSFMPASFVDETGNIFVKPSLQTESDDRIFVVGDVGKFGRKFLTRSQQHSAVAAANLLNAINGQPTTKTYSEDTFFMGAIQLGTWGGSGALGWFSFPTFLVKLFKGKELMVSRMTDYC